MVVELTAESEPTLAAVQALTPEIRAAAEEIEASRRLPQKSSML